MHNLQYIAISEAVKTFNELKKTTKLQHKAVTTIIWNWNYLQLNIWGPDSQNLVHHFMIYEFYRESKQYVECSPGKIWGEWLLEESLSIYLWKTRDRVTKLKQMHMIWKFKYIAAIRITGNNIRANAILTVLLVCIGRKMIFSLKKKSSP